MRKYVRLIVAAFGIVFAVFVALQFRRRAPEPVSQPVTRTDPTAVVESTDGTTTRFKFSRQDVVIAYDRQLTYDDGTVNERSGHEAGFGSLSSGELGGDQALNLKKVGQTGSIRKRAAI